MIKLENVSKSFRDKTQEKIDRKKDYFPIRFIRYFRYKRYVKALDNISFEVKKGEIFGLLGPNGAGKTTLSKLICGLLKQDKGKVYVFNEPIQKISKFSKRFNVVFARANLFWQISGKYNLELYSKVYDVKDYNKKIEHWLEFFELEKIANNMSFTYSTGESMRFKIAKSLLNEPELLILDEPTIGLDINMALKVRDLIKQLNKRNNVTIFLTTHYMEEADYLCDKIAILNKGEIIKIGTPKQLKSILKKNKIIEIRIVNFNSSVLNNIKNSGYVKDIEFIGEEEKLRVILKNNTKIEDFITYLNKKKFKISSMNVEEPSLADAYLYLTGQELISNELL